MAEKGNVKQVIIAVAIAILFVMFVAYAIQSFYPAPEYEDFCSSEYRFPAPLVKESDTCAAVCVEMWDLNDVTCVTEPCDPVCEFNDCGLGCGPDGITSFETEEDCMKAISEKGCYDEYDNSREIYNRNVFFVSLIIGIIAIVVSVLLSLEFVSAGFMSGGVLLIVYGTIRYWGSLSDVLRTLMLGFALIVLVWIGYKKLR
jgi:hypothetical protein